MTCCKVVAAMLPNAMHANFPANASVCHFAAAQVCDRGGLHQHLRLPGHHQRMLGGHLQGKYYFPAAWHACWARPACCLVNDQHAGCPTTGSTLKRLPCTLQLLCPAGGTCDDSCVCPAATPVCDGGKCKVGCIDGGAVYQPGHLWCLGVGGKVGFWPWAAIRRA